MSQLPTAPSATTPPLFVNDREVARLLGCARATVWRALADPSFPRPVRLLGRRVAWRVSEVEEWAAARERAR